MSSFDRGIEVLIEAKLDEFRQQMNSAREVTRATTEAIERTTKSQEQRVADLRSEIREAELRMGGNHLDAQLEKIRRHYRRRIAETRDASEKELLIRKQQLESEAAIAAHHEDVATKASRRKQEAMRQTAQGMEQQAQRSGKMVQSLQNRLLGVTAIVTALNSAARALEHGLRQAVDEGRPLEEVMGEAMDQFLRGIPILGSLIQSSIILGRAISGAAREARELANAKEQALRAAEHHTSVSQLRLRLEIESTESARRRLDLEHQLSNLQIISARNDDERVKAAERLADAQRRLQTEQERVERMRARPVGGARPSERRDAEQRFEDAQREADIALEAVKRLEEIEELRLEVERKGYENRLKQLEEAERVQQEAEERAAQERLRRIASLESSIQQQLLQAEGRNLEARLEQLRDNFQHRIDATEDATERELMARLHALERERLIEDERVRNARRVSDIEHDIQRELLLSQGQTFEARLADRRRHYERLLEAAQDAAERERIITLRALEEQRLIEEQHQRELEQIRRQEQKIADLESDVRAAELRAMGEHLEAQLERIRHYYDQRIAQAEDAAERELLIRRRQLALEEAMTAQAATRVRGQVDTIQTALGGFRISASIQDKPAGRDLQEKELQAAVRIEKHTNDSVRILTRIADSQAGFS